MTKSFLGIAAAAALFIAVAPAPANAFAVRHAPGVQEDQAMVDQVRHRGYPHRRYRAVYGCCRVLPNWGYPYAYLPNPNSYAAPYRWDFRPYFYGRDLWAGVGPVGSGWGYAWSW